jgi:L-alanine-DL-glutamate epimerase-like enolase superfamily enzyme
MAKIDRVEVLMVDLKPQVKRTDAIQAFVSQETPMVRIFSDDGLVGAGYSYTIGTGGHAVVDLVARHLAPILIGRDPASIEAIWRDLLFHTHATSVGAITSLALCAIDMALWDMRCLRSGRPLHIEAGGAQASNSRRQPWLRMPSEPRLRVSGAPRSRSAAPRTRTSGGSKPSALRSATISRS